MKRGTLAQPPVYWRLRSVLPPGGRTMVRLVVDRLLGRVVGSIQATRSPDTVCLTFDDGPDPTVTPELLKTLSGQGVRATFFILVAQSRAHPELVRELVDAGHEIALHGVDHRRLTSLSMSDAVRYLTTAKRELETLSGVDVVYYRPPYGAQSLASYVATRRAGLRPVVWNADAADWVDRPGTEVARDAITTLRPGSIFLFHERLEPDPQRGAPVTSFTRADVVEQILLGLKERGLRSDTVGATVAAHGSRRSVWLRP